MVSTSSLWFLHLLVAICHASNTSFLRGGHNQDSSLDRFSWDGAREDLPTQFHRGLEGADPLPLIMFILWCYCLCSSCRGQNQAQPYSPVVEMANDRAQPRIVTATATKLSPDTQTNVSFTGTDFAQVSQLEDKSIFQDTELRSGMKVVSINNIRINSSAHAAQVIAAATSTITILAHTAGYFGNTEDLVTATACKEQPDQPVGVVYQIEDGSNRMLLKSVSETSLFANSDLSAGMELVAINNVKLQSTTQAINLTVEAFPFVTILARRNAAVAVEVDPSDDTPVATAIVMAVPC